MNNITVLFLVLTRSLFAMTGFADFDASKFSLGDLANIPRFVR